MLPLLGYSETVSKKKKEWLKERKEEREINKERKKDINMHKKDL